MLTGMKAKMMSVFVNLSVVLDNHKQLQGCLAIFGLLHLVISLVVLSRKPISCRVLERDR